jgi:hypothetical protein
MILVTVLLARGASGGGLSTRLGIFEQAVMTSAMLPTL